MMASFENNPEYVRPFATVLGSMTNTGWYQSASIDPNFSFYIGLPVSLAYITSNDRSYSGDHVDTGCGICRELSAQYNVNCDDCVAESEFKAPTLFGRDPAPSLCQSVMDVNGNVIDTLKVDYSDGIDGLKNLPLMPFASLQAGFSYYHTELKLRYIGAPPIRGISAHLPGVGLQHDLASFLPEMPVSISAAANFTFLIINWDPGVIDNEIEGELTLRGVTNFAGILVGYKLKKAEFFLETGWEHSKIRSGGTMTSSPGTATEEIIKPDLLLRGRNAFRAALGIAFNVGIYPVIGQAASASFPTNASILGYKYMSEK